MVTPLTIRCSSRSVEYLGGVVTAELLVQIAGRTNDLLAKDQRVVDQFELAEAYVAGIAGFAVEHLSEMLDDRPVPASDAVTEVHHRGQRFQRPSRAAGSDSSMMRFQTA